MFISIVCEDVDFNNLSGKYNFHSINNNAAVYMRDGEKIKKFDPHPYYLAYQGGFWVIQDSESFDSQGGSWLKLKTKGL